MGAVAKQAVGTQHGGSRRRGAAPSSLETRDLRRDVEVALRTCPRRDSCSVTFEVSGDSVALNGYVRSWSDKLIVLKAVQATHGVRRVEDWLQVWMVAR